MPKPIAHYIASLSRALLVLLILSTSVWAQESAAPGEAQTPEAEKAARVNPEKASGRTKEVQDALATLDQSSPKATLTSFLFSMNQVAEGKDEFLVSALQCIFLDDLPQNQRAEQGEALARELFLALNAITIDFEDFKSTEEINSADYNVTLGTNDTTIPVYFNHNKDGAWRFRRDKLEAQVEKDELKEVIQEAADALTAIDDAVDPRLSTPRQTLTTFFQAFKNWEDGGLEDAVATLDMSEVSDAVSLDIGGPQAVQLKNILDRHEYYMLPSIPNDPTGPPFVLLKYDRDPTGRKRIELVPIPLIDTPDAVEWKFSKSSIEILNELWDDVYKDREVVPEITTEAPKVMSLILRDWMVENAPFLMDKLFIIENWKWLGMFFSILLGMIVSRIASTILLRFVRRSFREKQFRLDEKLEKGFIRPVRIGIMAWVWWLAIKPLMLPEAVLLPLKTMIITVSSSAFVWAVYRLVDIIGNYIAKKAQMTDNKYDDLVVPLIVRSLKVFVIFIGFIFVCQMNDWKYQTALAGFGLVGMATALAAKDTLGNVFGSLTVLVDRPFQIGDWIQVDNIDGSVESVGIRSTRVRTFYNSVLIVPNSILTTAVIDNYGERKYRRLKMDIGITYDTPPEKIDAFCEGIRELIRQHPYTRTDYFHVYLNTMGDSSLNIMLYCFHECPDWSTELRERHRLLLDIIRLAKALGVEFAFPTSTLYMQAQAGAPQEAINVDENKALLEGRRQAVKIVNDTLGKNETAPAPVTFDTPPGMIEDDGDEGDE